MADTPFSKRHGYTARSKEITIREDAPENLRFAILHEVRDTAKEYIGGYPETDIRLVVSKRLNKRVHQSEWHHEDVWEEVEHLVYSCDWFHVYNLIEDVQAHFKRRAPAAAKVFAERMNEVFIEQGIGWQLVNGKIATRGEDAFEAVVKTAQAELEEAGRPTAAGHIHDALQALSRRPKPNTAGAVYHAMGSLECVARDVTGEPKATLGEVLKRHPGLVPKPLDSALAQVWGYASNAARHVEEGREPEREEAELVVGLAATVATYLNRKHS